MLKNIWKDPVWSKVISAAFLWLITLGYAYVKSITDSISIKQAVSQLSEPRVSVLQILLGITVILFLYFVIREIGKPIESNGKASIYNDKQTILMRLNKVEYPNEGVLFRWQVFFDFNGNPFIDELDAYCTKHGSTPLRFIDNSCSVRDCSNSQRQVDFNATKNQLESELIDKWEKLNN
ncbi:hypothetical protein [Hymenobacter bucti]|uniref:Uncharacterized protein n=1 Tax=Hymenobacter bucti TaxID=1844114 RepID=A0ABW4QUV8_9BACT